MSLAVRIAAWERGGFRLQRPVALTDGLVPDASMPPCPPRGLHGVGKPSAAHSLVVAPTGRRGGRATGHGPSAHVRRGAKRHRIAAPLETPMKTRIAYAASALALAVAVVVSPVQSAARGQVTPQGIASLVQPQAAEAVTVSVFATGLYNPPWPEVRT